VAQPSEVAAPFGVVDDDAGNNGARRFDDLGELCRTDPRVVDRAKSDRRERLVDLRFADCTRRAATTADQLPLLPGCRDVCGRGVQQLNPDPRAH
jgi:hypothetical protein